MQVMILKTMTYMYSFKEKRVGAAMAAQQINSKELNCPDYLINVDTVRSRESELPF